MWILGPINGLEYFKWVLLLIFKEDGRKELKSLSIFYVLEALLCKQVILIEFSQQPRKLCPIYILQMSTSKHGKIKPTAPIHVVSHWELNRGKIHQKVMSFYYYPHLQLFVKCFA